MVDKDVIFIII
jgi:cGMP-dependent protein kinase